MYAGSMSLNQKIINGVNLSYLGSLTGRTLIIVVGRNNFKKSSESLDALVKELHALGHSICWFENRHTQTAKFLDAKFERLWGSQLSTFCQRTPLVGNLSRKLIKASMLLLYPRQWGFFISHYRNSNQHLAKDLQKLISYLPVKQVFLLSHSAGGIVSSLVESEEKVAKLVCFGYPFKHPEHEEERTRTAHLENMTKPFLIIQGDHDEYGTALDSDRYTMAPCIKVVSVQADHGYDKLSPSAYQKCLEALRDFYS